MKKGLRNKSLLLVLTAVLLVATACGNGGTAESPGASGSPGAADPGAGGEQVKDPFGPLPEKTKITIFRSEPDGGPEFLALPEGETLTDNRYIDEIEERFNLDIEFPVVVKNGSDKAKLMIASNDITDVMIVGYADYRMMIENDMIEDITEEFEDYASPQLKAVLETDGGKALELAKVDGKLYGIPTMGTVHNSNPLLWLRKDWLDKLGLPEPKTIDDLEKILKAFIEQDPDGNGQDDTIGLPGVSQFAANYTISTPGMFGYDAIFDAYKSYTGMWVKAEDGTVQWGSIQPETKQALAKLNEMYKAGLLPRDFAIMKHEQAVEQVVSGKAGAFFGPWWSGWSPLNDAIRNDKTADWRAYALLDVDGKSVSKQEMPVGVVAVVKKGFKYPEAMIKMINYGYQVQLDDPNVVGGDPYAGLPLPNWQTLPVPMALWRADSVILDHVGILAASKGEPLPEGVGEATLENYRVQGEYWAKGIDWLKENPDFYGEPISRIYGVQPIIENDTQPLYSEFYGLTRTMEQKMTNLDKLETDAFIKIITGEQPVDYFDTFVEEWKKLGGEQITKEVNESL